jgi:hypothetical protein
VIASADRLKALAGCWDVGSLKSAVREMCAEFGQVTRIDIFTMAEAAQRRARLMASLGISRFGNDVLVIVDLPKGAQRHPW